MPPQSRIGTVVLQWQVQKSCKAPGGACPSRIQSSLLASDDVHIARARQHKSHLSYPQHRVGVEGVEGRATSAELAQTRPRCRPKAARSKEAASRAPPNACQYSSQLGDAERLPTTVSASATGDRHSCQMKLKSPSVPARVWCALVESRRKTRVTGDFPLVRLLTRARELHGP